MEERGYNSKRILWEMRFACIFQELSSRRLINTDKIYGPKKEREKGEGHDNVYMYILYIIYINTYQRQNKRNSLLTIEYEIVRIQWHIFNSLQLYINKNPKYIIHFHNNYINL